MKRARIILASLMVLVMSQPAMAQFYRYVDSHGNVLYTDDINKIPLDQRDRIQPYEASETDPDTITEKSAPDLSRVDSQEAQIAALEKERARLTDMERTLNQEFEALTKERNDLDEEMKKAVTTEQIKVYNEKIAHFNSRIQSYEEKRNTYSDHVEAFNKRAAALPSESN
jgi:peptidoglycan hydrolase CwlO-like protein